MDGVVKVRFGTLVLPPSLLLLEMYLLAVQTSEYDIPSKNLTQWSCLDARISLLHKFRQLGDCCEMDGLALCGIFMIWNLACLFYFSRLTEKFSTSVLNVEKDKPWGLKCI